MLNGIVDLSLRYKLLVLLGFVLLTFFGVRAVLTVPVDAPAAMTICAPFDRVTVSDVPAALLSEAV